MIKIYHNARCSKSRTACSIVEEKGIETTVIDYFKTPPSEDEIRALLTMLKIKAEDLVRKSESLYKEKYKESQFSEAEWIKILSTNPVLIERPILVNGNKAVIGRSPDKVLELIK